MALRFVRAVWEDWRSAVRELASVVSSILRDEDQPPRWIELTSAAQAINPSGLASPPTWDSAEAAWSFSPTTINVLQGYAQLPHTWDEGSTAVPTLYLYYNGTASPGTAIQWRFRYRWYDVGSAIPAWTTLNVTSDVSVAAGISYTSELGRIAGANKRISSLFAWEIARIGSDVADTYSSPVFLSEFDFLIKVSRNRGSARRYRTGYD